MEIILWSVIALIGFVGSVGIIAAAVALVKS